MKIIFEMKIFSAAFLLSLCFTVAATAQNGNQNKSIQDQNNTTMQDDQVSFERNADQWSTNLGNRINLNTSQRDSVRTILLDYQRQRSALEQDMDDARINEFNTTFNSRIEGILEESQVENFNTYSRTWWNDINTNIRDSRKKMNDPEIKMNVPDRQQDNPNEIRNDDKRGSNPAKIDFHKT